MMIFLSVFYLYAGESGVEEAEEDEEVVFACPGENQVAPCTLSNHLCNFINC